MVGTGRWCGLGSLETTQQLCWIFSNHNRTPNMYDASSLFVSEFWTSTSVEILESLKRMFSGQLHQLLSFSSNIGALCLWYQISIVLKIYFMINIMILIWWYYISNDIDVAQMRKGIRRNGTGKRLVFSRSSQFTSSYVRMIMVPILRESGKPKCHWKLKSLCG